MNIIILFDERFIEDSLDYFGIHGMLCAFSVGPVATTADQWTELAFGQPVSAAQVPEYATVQSYLQRAYRTIQTSLNEEDPIELPQEAYEDREALKSWCAGFVEAFLLHEADWFEKKQELVAELMLPIMAVSDLFDDDDFSEIKSNLKLMDQLSEQIPEVLTDLYLLFHSGD